MNDILDEILGHIRLIKDDKQKLKKLLDFILEEIYEEEEDELLEIPEKFEKITRNIAESINAGFICFLNPETMEMEDIPKTLMDDPDEFEMVTGVSLEEEELKHEGWNEYYTFEPLDSCESFEIMEAFAENIDDEILQEELFYVLNHKKPFINFKHVIYNREMADDWFRFKMNALENHVKQIIHSEIHKMPENFDNNELPI